MATGAEVTLSLREQRMNLTRQQQTFVDELTGKEWSTEDHNTYNRMEAEYQRLNAEITRRDELETRANEAAVLREATAEVVGETGMVVRAAQTENLFRQWVRGELRAPEGFEVDITRARRERELLRDGATPAELRAMAWDATSGSLVVPTEMARTLYEFMEASIVAYRIGATFVNTSVGGPIKLPKLSTHGAGTQVVSQNLAIGQSDATFSTITLDSFKYGQLVQASTELLRDAAFNVEEFLGRDIGYALGRRVNVDLVIGDGSSKPKGMFVLTGAGTTTPVVSGGSLIAPTPEKWIDTQYTINDVYRQRASWLMKDATAGSVRKLRDGVGGTIGAFLWEPSLTDGLLNGQPSRFLGSPVYTDPNCTAGTNVQVAVYGDFSTYAIRTVGNPIIDRDDSIGFKEDSVWYRGKWTVDGDHRDVGAFASLAQTP
jgi:HK97 family phage major capsid protein